MSTQKIVTFPIIHR